MRDLLTWNLSLGRWLGTRVSVHAFFLAFAIVVLHLASVREARLQQTCWVLGIVFASAVFHELGHLAAVLWSGGRPGHVMLWPLGGLIPLRCGHWAGSEIAAALAGPAANLLVCACLLPLLLIWDQSVVGLLNPLVSPSWWQADSLTSIAALAFWWNWLLVLVNLLPCWPLDGIRIFQTAVAKFAHETAAVIAVRVSAVAAFAILLTSTLAGNLDSIAWLGWALLSLFLLFAARQEANRIDAVHAEADSSDMSDANELVFELAEGYGALRRPSRFRQWLRKRQQARAVRQQQVRDEEARKLDDVLARLHAGGGVDSLSPADRALLDRVSRHIRDKHSG